MVQLLRTYFCGGIDDPQYRLRHKKIKTLLVEIITTKQRKFLSRLADMLVLH